MQRGCLKTFLCRDKITSRCSCCRGIGWNFIGNAAGRCESWDAFVQSFKLNQSSRYFLPPSCCRKSARIPANSRNLINRGHQVGSALAPPIHPDGSGSLRSPIENSIYNHFPPDISCAFCRPGCLGGVCGARLTLLALTFSERLSCFL